MWKQHFPKSESTNRNKITAVIKDRNMKVSGGIYIPNIFIDIDPRCFSKCDFVLEDRNHHFKSQVFVQCCVVFKVFMWLYVVNILLKKKKDVITPVSVSIKLHSQHEILAWYDISSPFPPLLLLLLLFPLLTSPHTFFSPISRRAWKHQF